MIVIEPCCFQHQLSGVVASMNEGQSVTLLSMGDVTLLHLLSFFVSYVPGSHMMLVLPRLSGGLLSSLEHHMQQRLSSDFAVKHCTLISQGYEHNESVARLGAFRSSGRMLIAEDKVSTRLFTITNGDKSFTITGPLHQEATYGMHIWQLTLSDALCKEFNDVFRFAKIKKAVTPA